MARRIETELGRKLSVYDLDASKTVQFKERISSLSSIDASTIFTMLPSDKVLEQTFLQNRLFDKIPKNSMIIDFSTTSPSLSRRLNLEASKYGHIFIDSPVSGGIEAAKNGNLSLLMGCKEDEISNILPLLKCVSNNQIFLQKRGNGCVAKICNNFVLMSTMIATCEAIAAANTNGVDPALFVDVLNKCSGQSWVSSKYSPVPIESLPNSPCRQDFNAGFQSTLALKDLSMAKGLFDGCKFESSVIDPVIDVYQRIVQEGKGAKDIGVYIKEIL